MSIFSFGEEWLKKIIAKIGLFYYSVANTNSNTHCWAISVYTEAPIEKIQVTVQAGDQAPTKMVRLVTFEDPEAQVSSRKAAIKRVKKILDDTDGQVLL